VVRYSVYDAACFLGAVDTSDSAVAATFVPTAQHQGCCTDAANRHGGLLKFRNCGRLFFGGVRC
jgi:hypothetical protein